MVMRKIKTKSKETSITQKLLIIAICLLLIQDVVFSFLIEFQPIYARNHVRYRVKNVFKKHWLPKKTQIQRSSNNIVRKGTKGSRNPVIYSGKSPGGFLDVTAYGDESIDDEIEPKLLGRTYQYLYNRTHDQGLDTIIYVPFIERVLGGVSGRIHTVYPGTIWCGVGNQAQDETSLGYFSNTDRCCRDHDLCHDSIPPKAMRHGLRNPGFFTRSHCDCDRRFYRCLKVDNSMVSRKIGVAYFNILRPQCFRKEFPIMFCWIWFNGRCLNYIVDDRRSRAWQWFDNKPF